jgi:hypothetical protein
MERTCFRHLILEIVIVCDVMAGYRDGSSGHERTVARLHSASAEFRDTKCREHIKKHFEMKFGCKSQLFE